MRVKSKAMAEYIDRQDLIKFLENIQQPKMPITQGFKYITIDECIRVIKEKPPVDVAPIIHAKWEHNYKRYGAPIECTNCKQEAHVDKRCMFIRSLYCPHCGAKMDKE